MDRLTPLDPISAAHGATPADAGDAQARSADLDARFAALVADNARLREAVEARDSFLAVAAHELRNPMTPILGRVTMLRLAVARGLPTAEIAERIVGIERLVTQFIKRATTLLDVSRIASERIQLDCMPVDVLRVANDVVENFRPSAVHAGGSLALEALALENVAALADALALEQVLDNLVSNAIKYSEGAPITVRLDVDRERRQVVILVRDAGPGIAVDQHERIFERFERAVAPGCETAGYGVGLWVVRNLCDAMGGSVNVTSEPGKGATFRVTLPQAIDEETH